MNKAIAILIITLMTYSAHGQTRGASLAEAFKTFSQSRIDNEIFIPSHTHSHLVVLFSDSDRESLNLMSLEGGSSHSIWSLPKLPDFMSVVDPLNLHVLSTDVGPAITLHGCAQRLCGGHGLAGSLFYAVDSGHLYTAYASWSNSKEKATFVYSSDIATNEAKVAAAYLNQMLSEEGYKQ
jgi:hypothetical protein